MLNQSSIFGKYALLLILLISGSVNLNAQFDSIIFARNDIYAPQAVIYMGDQNDDGCDDFVLCRFNTTTGLETKALLFYGGQQIDSTPALTFNFLRGVIPNQITACDFNRDGYRDLIIAEYKSKPLKLNIYLGGPNFDTLVDFSFRAGDNSLIAYRFAGQDWPIDLNGDGFEELLLILYNTDLNSNKGAFYIYNSSLEMDSIPIKVVTYAPSEEISFFDITHGDLDGDGRTDLTFKLTDPSIPLNFALRRFVFGRSDFSFQDTLNFMDSVNIVRTNNIIQDINKDGKSDLIVRDTKFKYPYWYIMAVSYGSRNLDHVPEEGFNTQNQGFVHTRSVGDVNGDGYGDFLSSLDGSGGRLFVGGKHKIDDTPIRYYGNSFNILGRVGDVNGDGLDDIGIGKNGATYAQPGTFYIMSGERVAMAVEDEADGLTTPYEIDLTISPNPTNGPVTLQYTLPGPGE
ncbi:MAG: hypothetical protein EDM75_10990, partial [Chlorobiota bacterium]